jgi:hypothetical protein
MNASSPTATVTGRTSGMASRRHIRNGATPSSRAASNNSPGIRRKLQ